MAVRRNNKAKKDKDSILADVKNLLFILHPALQKMPKIERMEGAPHEMKAACYNMIRHFNTAKECPEVRLDNIRAMFGEYGVLMAAFDLCVQWGLLTDSDSFRIAIQLEKIKEGVGKWRNSVRSAKSQARTEVGGESAQEPPVSTNSKREGDYHS